MQSVEADMQVHRKRSHGPLPSSGKPKPEAHFKRGVALQQTGRLDQAIAAWRCALAANPYHADSVIALGEALLKMGKIEEAALLLSPACQRHPGDVRLLRLNGRAFLAAGRPAAALGALLLALDIEPNHADTRARLVEAFHADGNMEQVLVHCIAAFERAPDHVNAAALGAALVELEQYGEGLALLDHALALCPGDGKALIGRAGALDGLLRFEEAITTGEQAVAALPGSPTAQYNLATFRLGAGRMTAEVWDEYEYRLRLKKTGLEEGGWYREDVAGRTILLRCEQGLGDTLQFVRYAPLVAARGARVILAVQPPLLRLLQGTPGVDQIIPAGPALPAFDLFSPLLSLPRVFGTTLKSIPPPLPYAAPFERWEDGVADLRVGLVWAGGTVFIRNRQRSMPIGALAGLAGIPGVQFYSLQRQEGPPELPPGLDVIDLMHGVEDFADTAARVAGLDLVVAVDTAVAHLAATMGKAVWLLSRFRGCWRWLNEGEGSPWYPSLRVLRQATPGGWAGLIEQVRRDLMAIVAQPVARPLGPCEAALVNDVGGTQPGRA